MMKLVALLEELAEENAQAARGSREDSYELGFFRGKAFAYDFMAPAVEKLWLATSRLEGYQKWEDLKRAVGLGGKGDRRS